MSEVVENTDGTQTDYTTETVDWKAQASEENRSALENYETIDDFIKAKQSFESSARSKAAVPKTEDGEEEAEQPGRRNFTAVEAGYYFRDYSFATGGQGTYQSFFFGEQDFFGFSIRLDFLRQF